MVCALIRGALFVIHAHYAPRLKAMLRTGFVRDDVERFSDDVAHISAVTTTACISPVTASDERTNG